MGGRRSGEVTGGVEWVEARKKMCETAVKELGIWELRERRWRGL